MSILKKLLPFRATRTTPAELQEIHARLDSEMQGLTQEWALESLDIDRFLPLINIADNEPLGVTNAILYGYRYGFLDGKKETIGNIEKYLHRKGKNELSRKEEIIQEIVETLQTINSTYTLNLILRTAKCLAKDEHKGD